MTAIVSGTGKPMLAAALMIGVSVVPVAWLEARPHGGAEVAAVFPPWTARESVFGRVAAAGGLPVRPGVLDSILVVHGEDPGLIDRLYENGAWAVIDPVAFGGCLVRSPGAAK